MVFIARPAARVLGCRDSARRQRAAARPKQHEEMHHLKRLILLACALTLWLAPDGSAQTGAWTGRGFVNVNGGTQGGAQDFDASWTFSRYGENGRFEIRNDVDRSGGLFDLSGGARIWRNLAFGIGFSRVKGTTDASVSATVPHPLFVGRPRTATASRTDLTHTERAVHFQAVWVMPLRYGIDLAFSAGPSVISLEQSFLTDAEANEVGAPFSQVSLSTTTTEQKKSGAGFNAGVDVNYMVTPNFGAGLLLRYAGGSIEIPFRSDLATVDIGGFHVGGGLRVRF